MNQIGYDEKEVYSSGSIPWYDEIGSGVVSFASDIVGLFLPDVDREFDEYRTDQERKAIDYAYSKALSDDARKDVEYDNQTLKSDYDMNLWTSQAANATSKHVKDAFNEAIARERKDRKIRDDKYAIDNTSREYDIAKLYEYSNNPTSAFDYTHITDQAANLVKKYEGDKSANLKIKQ